MKIWCYWLTETRTLRCMGESGDPFEYDDEAVAEHRRRLRELHGWFEDGEYARPICEPVVYEQDSLNVVTRNRYVAHEDEALRGRGFVDQRI